MKLEANLFYNYHTIGDILMLVVDSSKESTSFKMDDNACFIYNEDKLIGINFYNISQICKIKSRGKIFLTPNPLIDILNSLLKNKCDYEIKYQQDSGFIIGKIIDYSTINEQCFLTKVDIGNEIINIITRASNIEINKLCVVAKIGSMLPSGKIINKSKIYDTVSNGYLCTYQDIAINLYENENRLFYLEDEEALPGQDFFLSKGKM